MIALVMAQRSNTWITPHALMLTYRVRPKLAIALALSMALLVAAVSVANGLFCCHDEHCAQAPVEEEPEGDHHHHGVPDGCELLLGVPAGQTIHGVGKALTCDGDACLPFESLAHLPHRASEPCFLSDASPPPLYLLHSSLLI